MTRRRRSPLPEWLSSEALSPLWQDEALVHAGHFLGGVASELEAPRRGFPYGGFESICVKLTPPLRERAEALFFSVWESAGSGKQRALLDLLSLIGFTADPASIPFWKRAAALSRVGDTIAGDRRDLVAAGLGLTAFRHPASEAFQALEALTRSEHTDARTSAVDALAYLASMCGHDGGPPHTPGGPLSEAAAGVLRRVAAEPGPFAPRLLARRFLLAAGEPFPPYDPQHAVAFEVALGKARRTVELRADQTLDDLRGAILDAFGWDHEHLHCFALSNDLGDDRFSYPPFDEEVSPEEGSDEEASFPLGAMDLPAGHRFVLLYDLGDQNVFRIKVAGARPLTPRAKYPRVTARVGKDPAQYASW